MAGGPPMGPFSMPMYREWFPEKLRPWMYLLMVVIVQLTGGIYLGNLSLMMGEWGMMREDVMYAGLCNVIGVSMPFPLLFKFKFRYSNKQLLVVATSAMIVCNVLTMHVRFLPLLCLLSFTEGFFKLWATFELASNIQLWMTPKRDFSVFFPLLYIIVLGDISLSPWVAVHIADAFDSWQMVHWFYIGLLMLCLLFQIVCLKRFYIMRMPIKSIDWLGMIMWALTFMGLVWIFTYADYYNWGQGKPFRDVCVMVALVVLVNVGRMVHIRHPYISADLFKTKALWPLMIMYCLGEWMNSTPKSLGNMYFGAVMHWGSVTTSVFDFIGFCGTVLGCLFSLYWLRGLRQTYTRLLTIGFVTMMSYQAAMYFLVSPATSIEMLYLPTLLRAFGYAIFFTTCTIHLQEILTFQTFFMGLTIAGIAKSGVFSPLISSIYTQVRKRVSLESLMNGYDLSFQEQTLVALKYLFGATCVIGTIVFILLILFEIKPVRSTMKKMPSWIGVGKLLRRQQRHDDKMRRKAAMSNI